MNNVKKLRDEKPTGSSGSGGKVSTELTVVFASKHLWSPVSLQLKANAQMTVQVKQYVQ